MIDLVSAVGSAKNEFNPVVYESLFVCSPFNNHNNWLNADINFTNKNNILKITSQLAAS